MAETPDPNAAAFPTLDDAQMSRLAPFGVEVRAKAGDTLSIREMRATGFLSCARVVSKSSAFRKEISASGLKCARSPYTVELDDGGSVKGRSIIVASGAQSRRLDLANLAQFEGIGVYYGATAVESQLCQKEEVAVVGGGDSAGQAALYLAGFAKHVHLSVRGPGLTETMSRYLIARIEACKNITLKPWTTIDSIEGDGHLERVRC